MAFIPLNIWPSRVYMTARVASVYHPFRQPEGRVRPLAGESSTSIFIEWNWICLEDRPVLARLLSSLTVLSDSPHRHLQNNHPNNTGSLQYVKCVLTPSPNQSLWKSQFSLQQWLICRSTKKLFTEFIKPLRQNRYLWDQHIFNFFWHTNPRFSYNLDK